MIEQKEGRNTNSNLLRTFFRTLEVRLLEKSSLMDIIKRRNINITFEYF